MPPVARDRKAIAVQLLTMDADGDYLSLQHEVTRTNSEMSLSLVRLIAVNGRVPGYHEPLRRNLIEPVFAPPTKRYQFVGDPIPLPSSAPNHQHKWTKDYDLPSAGDQNPVSYDHTKNVQIVALHHVPAGTYHITVRADNTPVPDQAQNYAICALGNSELEVRG